VTSRDNTPGCVAVFVSIFVCFPCFLCSACLTVFYYMAALNPEWASESVQMQEVLPSSGYAFMSAGCSSTTLVALLGGIVLLIWGLRSLRPRPS
jgi:hypothetical protein